MALASGSPYPAQLDIDYPKGPRDRLTVGLRIFWAIPALILVGTIGGAAYRADWGSSSGFGFAGGVGALFIPVLLMIVFRQKYPGWWFDFNREVTRFGARVGGYLALLSDRYPATDDEQFVHLDLAYPDVEHDLNRWLPLVKWLLAIPHFIILFFLGIAAFFVIVYSWFAILFTGNHPRGAFDFVVGVMRWGLRVDAYAFLLITDRYPPFSLDP